MKKEAIFSATLSLLEMAALAVTYSEPDSENAVIVRPGPVAVKQGNNASLQCHLEPHVNDSQNRWLPVHWQSPPHFKTRTSDCHTFGSSTVKRKYVMSCAERWYNMTITDVQWADKGKYRCIHTNGMAIVNLQVLVPIRRVSLTYVRKGIWNPLVLSKGDDVVLTCTTDCAYPAPTISWFENGLPFNASAIITTTESGCSGRKRGQKRIVSNITVRGKPYVEKERYKSNISCEAGNIFGEKKISKAIVVTYDVTSSPLQLTPSETLAAVVLVFLLAAIAVYIILDVARKFAGSICTTKDI